VELAPDYIIQQFYTYCKRPQYKKGQGVYNAECPVCKEGSSSGTKRRLFYFPDEHYFYCFNCSRSWSEFNWLQEVTRESTASILKNSKTHVVDLTDKNFDFLAVDTYNVTEDKEVLPTDAIDLLCTQQIEFIKAKYPQKTLLLNKLLNYLQERRLTTAINKPKSFFVSFDSKLHGNRLIIPFYDENNKLYTFQSRTLQADEYPKYITNPGEKCLYGENNILETLPYIFILEGPIDAMFIQNGVGIGGSTITDRQLETLRKHFDKELIYIFDNDKNNSEMKKTIVKHIKNNKKVFIWPKELKEFKDLNEVCCRFKIDQISSDFILKNSFSGIEAEVRYNTSNIFN
jgi:5S rRNA maturation endonuclease (ribonuclease M5)